MKKLFAILMSVLMIACFMPTMAFADGEDTPAAGEESKNPVAQVGDQTYASLSAAVEAVETNGTATITLLKDATEDITISANKKVTLNLNGKKLTNSSNDTITVANGAELTIEGAGTVNNGTHAKAAIFNNGTVVLNGGTYDRSAEAGTSASVSGKNSYYTIVNHGTMTINEAAKVQTAGGDTEKGKFSSLVENGYYNYSSKEPRSGYVEGTNQEKPTLTINGGTFLGGLNTIKNDDGGRITIKDGNFSNFYQALVQNHNIATIEGGTFTAAEGSDQTTYGVYNCGCVAVHDIGELTISGGTFTADYALGEVSTQAANVTISGGVFNGKKAAIGKSVDCKANFVINGGTYSSSPKNVVGNAKVFKVSDTKFMVATDDAKPAGYYWTAVEGEAWDYEGTAITYTPYVLTDNVTNQSENTATGTPATTTADINASTTTAADGTKTTTATVDDQTADKIVDKATANKSEQIIIDATSAAGAAAAAEVGIPEKTVKEITEKTDANLTFKTDAAKVQLDKNAVDALAAQAGTTGTVKLLVKTVKSDADIHQVELKLVTSNGAVTDFHGGNVTVTIKPSAALNAKEVICVYIDDNGVYHRVDGKKNADGTYTFTTGHFSTYAIMSVEDAEKVFAQQDAKAAEQAKEIKLQARSVKTAKGNIKVNLKVNEDAIEAIEDLGYTVKYKFYRSTIKNAKYVGKFETTAKTYTNTTGKKGTKYYYKARVMVYDAQGELVAKTALTQCKYACRIK